MTHEDRTYKIKQEVTELNKRHVKTEDVYRLKMKPERIFDMF